MINIMVTGVGSLLGQGIIKALKYSSLKYNLVGTDYFAKSVGLYWVNKGYILPDILDKRVNNMVEWLPMIIDIIKINSIDVVLVGLDFEVTLFARYKNKIEDSTRAKVVVSSPEVVDICRDKWKTVNFLKINGYNYPESCLPDNIDYFLNNNNFPLIVKPRFGSTSKDLFKVNNIKELQNAIKKCDKPIIQKIIGNDNNEFTCSSTFYKKEILTCISLRRELKNGNTSIAFSEKHTEIDKFIMNITKSLEPNGPTNFQLRITDKGPTVFEINPRFSGTTPIRAIFGVNEVEAVVNAILYGKTQIKMTQKEGVVIRYLDNQFITWEQYNEFK